MSDFEFDIENIDTTPDSINFLPVNDFYTTDHRLRVQWDIGNSFEPDSLDYVGLYNTEWETINEYLAYKWAPFTPRHPFSLRRRCVQFTDADFDHVRIPGVDFVFMYVANGDHVVGVSNKFQFRASIGIDDDLFFDKLEKSVAMTRKRQAKSSPVVSLIREPQLNCSPSKKKVTHVFRDQDTLTSDFRKPPTWLRRLDIVHPIVKEYQDPEEKAIVPYVPVFTAETNRQIARNSDEIDNVPSATTSTQCAMPVLMNGVSERNEMCSAQVVVKKKSKLGKKKSQRRANKKNVQSRVVIDQSVVPFKGSSGSIEYPVRLSLLPGPKGILEEITAGAGACTFCSLARIVISEMLRREHQQKDLVIDLKSQLSAAKDSEFHDVVTKKRVKRHSKHFSGSKEEMYLKKRIGELLKKNQGLLKQARHWKKQCTIARSEIKKLQLPAVKQEQEADKHQETQTTSNLMRESVETWETVQTTDSGCNTASENFSGPEIDENEWRVQKAKRIVRLQHVVAKQSVALQSVSLTVKAQRDVILKQRIEIATLRKSLSEIQKEKSTTERRLSEMTERVRVILRNRSKEKAQEWRQMAKEINNGIQDPTPAGAAAVFHQNIGATRHSSAVVRYPQPDVTRPSSAGAASLFQCLTPDVVVKQPRNFFGAIAGTVSSAFCGGRQPQYVGRTERMCPTCHMVFSPNVDPHVIDEHIVFHQIYTKKSHMD